MPGVFSRILLFITVHMKYSSRPGYSGKHSVCCHYSSLQKLRSSIFCTPIHKISYKLSFSYSFCHYPCHCIFIPLSTELQMYFTHFTNLFQLPVMQKLTQGCTAVDTELPDTGEKAQEYRDNRGQVQLTISKKSFKHRDHSNIFLKDNGSLVEYIYFSFPDDEN